MSVRTTVGLSRRPWRLVGAASAIALVLAMAPVSSATAAPVDPGDLTGQGLTSSDDESGGKATTSRLAQSDPAVLEATGTEQVPLLVKLDYDSVATYSGGVDNLQPTSPATTAQALDENTEAVQQYESYISGVEDAFVNELTATIPNAAVGSRLRTVFGGVAVSVPADLAETSDGSVDVGAALTPAGTSDRASTWATSTISSDSFAAPSAFLAWIASPSITMQNGHAVVTMSGSSSRASSTRSTLMRLPIRSSIHMRAPPAPQQKPRSLHRCISWEVRPLIAPSTSRGGV